MCTTHANHRKRSLAPILIGLPFYSIHFVYLVVDDEMKQQTFSSFCLRFFYTQVNLELTLIVVYYENRRAKSALPQNLSYVNIENTEQHRERENHHEKKRIIKTGFSCLGVVVLSKKNALER